MNALKKSKGLLNLAAFLAVSAALVLPTVANTGVAVKATREIQTKEALSSTYYESCRGLKGTALLQALATLSSSKHTTNVSYTGLRNYYLTTDVDPNNSSKVLLYYTGNSMSFSGTFGSSHGTVNREHVWCQSYLGSYTQTGPGSDLFNVHPIEATLNSTRNNRYFEDLSSGTYAKEYYSSSGYYTTGCLYNSTSFKPIDSYCGDTARSLFYVATRYYSYGYTLSDSPNASSMVMGKLSTLLKWNKNNAPTAAETRRNNAVEGIQGNRNPFIDHPEFATMIWDSSYSGSGALNDTTGTSTSSGGSSSSSGSESSGSSSSTTTSTSYSLTSSSLGLTTTSYANNNKAHTVNGISFTTYQAMKNSSYGIQFQKTNGYIYNGTAFGSKITKIVVTMGKSYSGTLKVYGSSSSNTATSAFTQSVSGTTYTYTTSGSYKYFKLMSPSATLYVSSIVIYL
ncbi:MAG: endonuclease [Bacilli bacterium]|nr:endonuclease [Bacilli bacterium]